jgi:hypothetical protein
MEKKAIELEKYWTSHSRSEVENLTTGVCVAIVIGLIMLPIITLLS